MDRNLLHPSTEKLFNAYLMKLQGSLFISSSSKEDSAMHLKYLINKIFKDERSRYGYLYYLTDYSVDGLRKIIDILNISKLDESKPRFIVIEDCHKMSKIMQNVLLKSLEEPSLGSHFILTTDNINQMIPTVLSRCQIIKTKKPLKADLFNYWKKINHLKT